MTGLLDVPQWLAVALLMTWGVGVLGVVALATALVRGERSVVAADPHEAAVLAAARARQWDRAAARLMAAPAADELPRG